MRLVVKLFVLTVLLGFYSQAWAQLDSGFAVNGRYVYNNGEYNSLVDIAQFPDGALLLAIECINSSTDYNIDFVVVKLTPEGELDTGFGDNGVLRGDFSTYYNSEPKRLQMFENGDFILSGMANNGGSLNDVVLLRYSSDGILDAGFGAGGVMTYQPSNLSNLEYRFFSSDETSGVLTGSAIFKVESEYPAFAAVTRLNHAWEIDTTFAETGTLIMDFVRGFSSGENAKVAHTEGGAVLDAIPLENGSFLFGGYYFLNSGLRVGFVSRVTSEAELDSTFGTSGFLTLHSPGSSESRVIAMQPNQDTSLIYALVRELTSPDNNFVIYAMSSSGEVLDTLMYDVHGKLDNPQALITTRDYIVAGGYSVKESNEGQNFRDSDYWSLSWVRQSGFELASVWLQDQLSGAQAGIQQLLTLDVNRFIVGGFLEGESNGIRDIGISRFDLDQATAIYGFSAEPEVFLYPNNVTKNGVLHVSPEVDWITIYSLTGVEVGYYEVTAPSVQLDLPSSGLFIVKMRIGGHRLYECKLLVTGS